MTEPNSPASVAFISPDRQLISLDGQWFRLTADAPFSPDGQWIFVGGKWWTVQQMPPTPPAAPVAPPVMTPAPESPVMAPYSPAAAPAGQNFAPAYAQRTYAYSRPARRRSRFNGRPQPTTVGFGLAGLAILALVTALAWPAGSSTKVATVGATSPAAVKHSGSSSSSGSSGSGPHTLSATITVYAPYAAITTGKCTVSSVERIEQTDGHTGVSYSTPPPRFQDVSAESAFSLKNAAGVIVATGQLDDGKLVQNYSETSPGYPNTDPSLDLPQTAQSSDNNGFCQYTFTAHDVPGSDFYQIQFGSEAPINVSKSALESENWQYKGTLGDAYAAKSETDTWYTNLCIEAIYGGGTCDLPSGSPSASPTPSDSAGSSTTA